MDSTDLLVIAAGVFAFALVSRRCESGNLTGPMAFTAFGLAVGPAALDLVDVPVGNGSLHRLAEVTLVLVLFVDASRIDMRRLDADHDVPLRLLGIALPLTIAGGTALALWLFPALTFWEAALLAAMLAPTDAALGQAVVSNPRVPVRIRQALNVESGLNDGLVFPLLVVLLSLAVERGSGFSADGWAVLVAAQLALGPLAGIGIGATGAILVSRCAARGWVSRVFLQISAVSLAVLAFAAAETIGGNGYLAAFTAGMVVGMRSRLLLDAIHDFGETEGQLLSLLVFLFLGAVLLPEALAHVEWRHGLYAVLSLTLVRMGPVALSLAGTRLLPVSVVYLGWFGPRGLASVLYLLLTVEGGGPAGAGDIATTVLLTVFMSILVHGASAAPATRAYARHLAQRKEAMAERRSVFAFPIRARSVVGSRPAEPSAH